jgi:dienelactone hydrolase
VFRSLPAVVALLALAAGAATCDAASTEKLAVRGQTLTLTIYPAHGPARGTIVMASGDVGWVGLAVSMAEEYSAAGYLVIGVNVRQYLASFTTTKTHLSPADVPGDYRAIAEFARARGLLMHPTVVSGMSEGAALAVLAAVDTGNRAWIDGVTKRDSGEPSFFPHEFVGRVSPLPLVMIQSRHDEYVSTADYERLRAAAREPVQLVLIDAANHRFTDRRKELSAAFTRGLAWVAQLTRKPA